MSKMSDSEDDSDVEENLPSQQECEERCQRFAEVTGTDSALAMFYLQDREWDVDRALNAFFEENAGKSPKSPGTSARGGPMTSVSSPRSVVIDFTKAARGTTSNTPPDPEPHRIRVLSWNIDGLDLNNLETRTKGVCSVINKENPHVVFLQEVVAKSLSILESQCVNYQVVPAGEDDYFTAMMLRIGLTEYEDSNILPFFSSLMMRNLLIVKCSVKGIRCQLMTSHLESTAQHAAERKKQLEMAFDNMRSADKDQTVIFGGDMNLRDKEMGEIGGLPENVYDVWEITGKRPEAKFTWDTQRNDNLEWKGKFNPRCRFDRMFLKHPEPKPLIKPVYFELVGIERLTKCHRFPSDHWGILTHYNILSKVPAE